MGYTTSFTGAVTLGRKLTLAEAKELLEINEMDREEAMTITGVNSYLQWVPSRTLDQIVWDGGEKFYDYDKMLDWACKWLQAKGIGANGTIYWQGEENLDTGILHVVDNTMTKHPSTPDLPSSGAPLTLQDLQKMALDQLTSR